MIIPATFFDILPISRGSVLHFERNCSDIFSTAIASGVGDDDDDDGGNGTGNDDSGVASISFDGTVTYGIFAKWWY